MQVLHTLQNLGQCLRQSTIETLHHAASGVGADALGNGPLLRILNNNRDISVGFLGS